MSEYTVMIRIVLVHGFPDNLRLHDRLVPHLESRRVLAVDFLGWGASDKPAGYPRHSQTAELAAVLDALSPAARSCSSPTTPPGRPPSTTRSCTRPGSPRSSCSTPTTPPPAPCGTRRR